MLGYDQWGSTPHSPDPPNLILADHHHHHHHHHQDHHDHHAIINHHNQTQSHHHHHRPMFDDPFSTPCTFPHPNNPPSSSSFYNFPQQQQFPFYDNDPRAFPGASAYHQQQQQQQQQYPLSLQDSTGALAVPSGSGYPALVPKAEPEYANRIGLNLGGRTYFAAADDDLVSRLYRRSRAAEPVNSPKCQAERCNADLSHAKHYHRRHKVCEFHSKAATVIAAGLTQRFCQQCSRFHLLSEFDNGKRSCRKRLADHNRRRRKSNQSTNRDHSAYSMSENAHNSSSQSIQRSPSDSGANSASSVTVAISSPRVSFDSSFRQRSYE